MDRAGHQETVLALTARPDGSYSRGVNGEQAGFTYRDYETLSDDGRRQEILDGQVPDASTRP